MAELIPIDAEPPGNGVREMLEAALKAEAKGDYSAVCLAIVHRDGATSHLHSALPSRSLMIGSLFRAMHSISAEF